MARHIKLPTREMGEVRLLLIQQEAGGTWEDEWELLRETPFGTQFSVISKEVLDHALHRWSKPLVDALGIPPAGALKKIPKVSRECIKRSHCIQYEAKNCFPEAKAMPWCYEPDGVNDETVRQTATRAIQEWRDGVHLVVIQ